MRTLQGSGEPIVRSLLRAVSACCLAVILTNGMRGNNIQVTNTSLSPDGKVRFNISWENSWRTNSGPENWDAAWIFVKFYDADSGYWRHAHLAEAGHTWQGANNGLGLEDPDQPFDAVTNRVVGVFVYRPSSFSGDYSVSNLQLLWPYGAEGVSYSAIDSVRVFAIEMVHVPQGSFRLGSGGDEQGHFYAYPDETSTFLVNTEDEIPVGSEPGYLMYPDSIEADDHFGDHGSPVPAEFPKGYEGFYMMKHEIAQQDYVDFLNTLTREQQNARTGTNLAPSVTSVANRYVMSNNSGIVYRQGIRCDATIEADDPIRFYCDLNGTGSGEEPDDGQWLACNYLSWPDVAAYLDWCGLRPMTELEFVKAARGPAQPVPGEYAWGTTDTVRAYAVINEGRIDEACATAGANALFGHISGWAGPMRVGIFATEVESQVQAGASYYGVLDLSGNLWERVVTIGRPLGRTFQGTMGDGILTASGNSTNADWPLNSYGGSGLLGGCFWASYNDTIPEVYQEYLGYIRTSDRNTAAHTPNIRNWQHGGRGVRNAP
jgi:formylglycine-generating enzyme required for sulfatase activity